MYNSIKTGLSNQLLLVTERKSEFKKLIDELACENITVQHVSKTAEAFFIFNIEMPEVIAVDSSNNEMACLEFCHAIKSNSATEKNIVIFISNCNDEGIQVRAFKAGADDFVIKPLFPMAFAERVKTRIQKPKDVISIQNKSNGSSRIRIDRESYTVYVGNDPLNLSRKEFELLYLMASQPGRIFSKDELSEKVWKRKMDDHERTIDVHILRIRKKLGQYVIYTQKGVGYKFAI